MIVVSDTSPIRGLIAIGKSELLEQLFKKVIVPEAVANELLRIKALETEIDFFLKQSWIEVRQVSHSEEYSFIRKHLDEGETEAIILAQQLNAELLLMDESKGRKLAKELHIKSLGLIGVLLKAKKNSLIPEVKPLLDELMNKHGFWIQKELYLHIIESVQENK